MLNNRKFVMGMFFKIIRKHFESDGTAQYTKRSCEEIVKSKTPLPETDKTTTGENLYKRPVRQEPGKVRHLFINRLLECLPRLKNINFINTTRFHLKID